MADVIVKPLAWAYDCLEVDIWNKDKTECRRVPSSEHWIASPKHMRNDYGIIKIVDPRAKVPPGVTLTIGMKDTRYPDVESAMAAAQADFERRVMSFLTIKAEQETP